MTLLTKLSRTPILTVGLRRLHRSALLQSHEDWDEKKFLLEEKPWEQFSPTNFEGLIPNPHPVLHDFFDEHHGLALKPVFYVLLLLGIVPLSIYGWWKEYQHLVVHPHRLPHPKHDFLHADGPRAKFSWGDGKHTPMHHPYYNFVKEGYETDPQGNPLPPGEYSDV